MMQKLIREIACMVMLVIAGTMVLYSAVLGLFACAWFASAMICLLGLLDFVGAWLCYREARTISRWLDIEMDSLRGQNMCLRNAIIELRRAQSDEHEDAGCPV